MIQPHLPEIINDLALILIVAGVVTLIFKALKQPVVLGYIVAGFLVSPSVQWLPNVADLGSIKVWAEIGVIFLLFALGLEFSFKKLAQVGSPAATTALFEIIGMSLIGFSIGQLFDWNTMDSLFLGGILAISSTTIIIKAFDEMNMKTRGFAKLVFGVLIVEDLVAILLIVILATIAVTQSFSGFDLAASTFKLMFFLTLWFVLGIFLLPSFLARARKHLNSETLLVVSLGLCFAMVVLATKVDFSPALGAFIMGSLLAETQEGKKIEELIGPLRDLFAAVFFVSVGMLIDLKVLQEHALSIVVISLGTILGKITTTTLGALFAGRSLKHSIQAGMSLAQIGEFSFIVASLGLSLKVTSDFLFPIAISVSAITTFTTPYLIRSADGVVNWMEKTLPSRWLQVLTKFHVAADSVSQTSDWKLLQRAYGPKILINTVIIVAVFLGVEQLLTPELNHWVQSPFQAELCALGSALLLSSPFLWALAFGRVSSKALPSLWQQKRYRSPLLALEVARWTLTLLLLIVLSAKLTSATEVILVVIGVAVLLALYFANRVSQIYDWLEKRFVQNLHQQKNSEKSTPPLAPWDVHLAEITLGADSQLSAKTYSEARVRDLYGVTVALVQRGSRLIPAPTSNEVFLPGDVLHVLGNDEQLAAFKAICEPQDLPNREDVSYSLEALRVDPQSPFVEKSIRESGLREKLGALVVGLEKSGQRIPNPDSSLKIEAGDVIWVVGNKSLIDQYVLQQP